MASIGVRAAGERTERGGILPCAGYDIIADVRVEEAFARGRDRLSSSKCKCRRRRSRMSRDDDRSEAGRLRLRLVRGCSLVVEPGFDADHLRALLSVLEEA